MDRRTRWPILLILALLLLPAAPAKASSLIQSGPPIAYGKVIQAGAFGVPFADTTNRYFPASYPVTGQSPLADQNLVYDTALGVEVVNANPYPITVPIVTEVFRPAIVNVLQNVTGPNGTYSIREVAVSVRVDVRWSNASLEVAPDSVTSTTVQLAYVAQLLDLEVHVGGAVWELQYLTPATASLAGVYTAAGLWGFAALIAGTTTAALIGALIVGERLARRIGRSPRVPFLWPAAWIGLPIIWFVLGYVSFNQTLGVLSPVAIPLPIAVAAFPYLPRLFAKNWDMVDVEGIEPLSLDEATNPHVILPIVRSKGGLRCAPETWREAFWSHWVGLPEVRGYEVNLLDRKVRVQPRLLRVSCPLPTYYEPEATASCWYDASHGIQRRRHRLRIWTETQQPRKDGTPRARRRFSPHVEPGFLQAIFPPKRAVALELAGIRNAEVEAHDNEVDRLEIAHLRGQMRHQARELAARSLRRHEEGLEDQLRPLTDKEAQELVRRTDREPKRGRKDADSSDTD